MLRYSQSTHFLQNPIVNVEVQILHSGTVIPLFVQTGWKIFTETRKAENRGWNSFLKNFISLFRPYRETDLENFSALYDDFENPCVEATLKSIGQVVGQVAGQVDTVKISVRFANWT